MNLAVNILILDANKLYFQYTVLCVNYYPQ